LKKIQLEIVDHKIKMGGLCKSIEPNVVEDSIFYLDSNPIGFFIKNLPEKASKFAELADNEFKSDNVPKTEMRRTSGINNKKLEVLQYSTILGSVAPNERMKRAYPSMSSVHRVKTAKNFIKAMLLLVKESENIIADILPEQYKKQVELFKNVPEQWKFGNLFTSSISNYNISARYHIDRRNLKETVNVIITKRLNSKGGNLNVPDYGLTVGQSNNSMLVYPAWRSMHGVTPIIPIHPGGYRNSLIFYPLKAFYNEKNS